MSNYQENKKTRRIAAVLYVFIMTLLVGGTYLSQQLKATSGQETDDYSLAYDKPDYGAGQHGQ